MEMLEEVKATRIDFYTGDKLHCIVSVTDIIILLVINISMVNIYDNQLSVLIYELKRYNAFVILVDTTYDDEIWFAVVINLDLILFIDINV